MVTEAQHDIARLYRFLERVRRSFAHDLPTPLGSIVNYATVLEATQSAGAEDVRDLGRRIRNNALRAARMLQLLANCTRLASRPLRTASTDLLTLARTVFTDAGAPADVQLAPGTDSPLAAVDAEVLGFAWRTYVAVAIDALGTVIHQAHLQVNADDRELVIQLGCGPDLRADGPLGASNATIELSGFLNHNGGPARLESSLGLQLAADLVVSHGGILEVSGRPGAVSGLNLRLPFLT